MSQVRRTLALLVLVLAAAGAARAEPLFTLSDDGRTILYRARPGDLPSGVAEMFGIPVKDLPAFLAANGISDATRVGAGFVYRIPNAPVRALSERAATLEAENARLTRDAAQARERADGLVHAADDARATAADAESRAARLVRMASIWPWLRSAIVALLVVTLGAVWIATMAMRRRGRAERYAATLARELDEKRQSALSERQESGRRILDLEARIRALEMQLGPRVVISGRS